jgi:hypothetical protein
VTPDHSSLVLVDEIRRPSASHLDLFPGQPCALTRDAANGSKGDTSINQIDLCLPLVP